MDEDDEDDDSAPVLLILAFIYGPYALCIAGLLLCGAYLLVPSLWWFAAGLPLLAGGVWFLSLTRSP